MKSLVELISPDRIVTLKSKTKEEALRELVDVISKSHHIKDKEELLKAILERERIMSTGIGLGIAVPHAKLDSVSDFVIAMGISKEGIEFNALDDKPVHIIVMIAGPNQQAMYLRTLAKVTLLLKNERIRRKIINSKSPEEVMEIIRSFGDE